MLSNTPVKILLVTDEAAIVVAVRGALQSTDLRADFRVVGSLPAYREAVAAGAPDLVLLDLHLPGGGVETVLTSPPESGVFPILVLVNQDAETLALAALQAGALDYLVKSTVPFALLSHSVRRTLREWNLRLDRQRAEESLQESERRYRTLFEQSPISIWEEDFSAVQEYFTELRARGVTDWAAHFAAHPEDVAECARRVRILNVNAAALKLFEAHDKAELLINLPNYFVAESYPAFREQMTAIATGKTEIAMEIPIHDLHGAGRTVSLFLSVLPGHEQTLDRVIVSFIDITESKQAEATLRASEQRFRLMADMMPVGVILSRLPDYTVQYVNPKAAEMFGGAQAQAAGRRTEDFYVNPADAAPVRRALEQSGVMESDEVLLRRVNGEQFWGLISGTVITDHGERIALAAVRDITEHKQTEERLQASLREKDTLLKEVHHRVKNNLQIVCSLLNLQTEGLQSEAAVAALRDTQNRVRAMALLHETLYQAGNLAQVKFAWYVDNLCAHLGRSLGLGDGRIQLELRVADVALPMEHAVPLGLIINELLSNAVKHAFPDGRSGRIVLELLPTTDHQLLLRVADDGVGLRSDFDVRQSRSLGLRLIFGLAEQLGGQAELKRADGTVFQLTFPGAAHEA